VILKELKWDRYTF